jgi:hypothetical protein
MVFLPNLGVNLRACLISLTLGKNPHFWIGNTKKCPSLIKDIYGRAPTRMGQGVNQGCRYRQPFFVVFEKIIVGDNERSSSRAMNAAIYTRRHALRPVHFTRCYSRSRTGKAR